jgi:DNA repair protein RecN (Recombination protein N)
MAASNSRLIVELASKAVAGLTEADGSVADSLSSVRRLFQDLERFDPVKGAEFATTCENALSILRELSGELSSYADSVDMDEREFAALEERLRVLQTLKRRYGPSLEDVAARLEKDKARVDVFENSERVRTEMAARRADAANAHRPSASSWRRPGAKPP